MASEEPPAAAPERIDHYRLVRRLALGGMAEIFLAVDEKTGRQVALKKILPQLAADPDFLDRFFHEIRIQIQLKHPNIVELLDCCPAPQNAYIVMEYIDGGELSDLKQAVGRFPWEIALYSVREALRGVGAAHRKGVIHRDMKPQNIMWTREGAVKIADFGISHAAHLTRLTLTGTVVGTPAHMSPEQARGEPLDNRTDLFSTGTVLYELLCGYNPFSADSVAATLQRVAETEPELPSLVDPAVPASVDRVVRRLHAKERGARCASAEDACDAIEAVFAVEGVADAATRFREFLLDPVGFAKARSARLAAESAAAARKLLEDRSAPPEEALWAAYKTVAVAPHDAEARTLLKVAAQRAGQRDGPVENARIRELEEALKKDPENLSILLQLAKLYRLEKDFINVMRFFRKLQVLSPSDPYTQGQIAALVSSPAVPSLRPPATTRPASSPVPDAKEGPRIGWGTVAFGGLVLLLLGFSLLWKAGPGRLAGTSPHRAAEIPTAPGAARQTSSKETPPAVLLQGVLEKGALLEKESPQKALALYRETLSETARDDVRELLLSTMADTAQRAGEGDEALAAWDQVITLAGPGAVKARIRKAELLEARHDDTAAGRVWEELAEGSDPEGRNVGNLHVAMAAEKAHDRVRALTLYEDVAANAPSGSDTANAARLGAAALYRAAGRLQDARRMYEEVKAHARPGSDFDRSADQELSRIGG